MLSPRRPTPIRDVRSPNVGHGRSGGAPAEGGPCVRARAPVSSGVSIESELQALAAEVREQLRWTAAIGGTEVPVAGASSSASPPAGASVGREPTRAASNVSVSPSDPNPGESLLRQLRSPGGGVVHTPAAPVARVAAAPLAPSPPLAATDRPQLPLDEKVRRLELAATEAAGCTKCQLHTGRTKSVFARGAPSALVAFVGEGPGYNEDQQGEPFVGAAGQLLDKMIAAMGLGPDEIYICNVVKCRPPENRTPLPDEAAACAAYLKTQLDVVAPRLVVALGRCAAENLGCALPGRSWRGVWGSHDGIPVMPTYHPAYLLRSPEMKRPVWEDLQKVLTRLGRAPKSG